jgi:hypothetical protein
LGEGSGRGSSAGTLPRVTEQLAIKAVRRGITPRLRRVVEIPQAGQAPARARTTAKEVRADFFSVRMTLQHALRPTDHSSSLVSVVLFCAARK